MSRHSSIRPPFSSSSSFDPRPGEMWPSHSYGSTPDSEEEEEEADHEEDDQTQEEERWQQQQYEADPIDSERYHQIQQQYREQRPDSSSYSHAYADPASFAPVPPASHSSSDPSSSLSSLPAHLLPFDIAARTIQRAYKRFSQRRIYFYFRDLILSRQHSNPYLLLRMINPQEGALLNDHANGLYLRFRLGGEVFPPIVYYKTFTSFGVTDVGAFAPRNYHQDRRRAKGEQVALHTRNGEGKEGAGGSAGSENVGYDPRKGAPSTQLLHPSQLAPTDKSTWYRRWENNGWRPLVHDQLLIDRDPVAQRTAAKKVAFHPSKVVRQLDVVRKRKGKKVAWLKKLYSSGLLSLTGNQKHFDEGREGATEQDEFKEGEEGGMDSDEEEWQRWKAAQANATPSELLQRLGRLDLEDPSTLLGGGSAPGGSGDWEEEADQLLDWCAGLADFDSYHSNWLTTATTRPNDPRYNHEEWLGAQQQEGEGGTQTAQGQQRPASKRAAQRATTASLSASSSASYQPSLHPSASAGLSSSSPGSGGWTTRSSDPATNRTSFGLSHSPLRQAHSGHSLGGRSGSHPSTLDDAEAAAVAAAAESALADAAAENADLPEWIQQTASRAQLEMLSHQHAALHDSLQQTLSRTQLGLQQQHNSSGSSSSFPQQVHLMPAASAGRLVGQRGSEASLASSHSSLTRLQQQQRG